MSTIDKSSAQEKFVSEYLGVKTTPRSGATIHRKGDLQGELSIFECKTYMQERESFTVKREWLTKLNKERMQDRKRFAFLIQNFGGSAEKDNHVVMKLEDFKEIYEYYMKQFEEVA